MSERTLTCRDCGQEFVFTLGEQEFYTQRGFSEPQRCPSCRQARKAQRNSGGSSYGNDSYGGGSSYGGGNSYGNDRGGYGGGRERSFNDGPRQLYSATCSECGQTTEVPFNPTPGKPVYCRECFQAKRQSNSYNSRW